MIKVLIADDHPLLSKGIQELLADHELIEVNHIAHNGKEVLSILKKYEIDVILLDINMPVMDGLETCKQVKKKYPKVAVLALTMYKNGSFVQQMLKNGALGYLLKNTEYRELVKAIKTVHNGKTYLHPSANQALMDSLMNKENKDTYIPTLTRREKEVLKLIAEEHTTTEIATKLHISTNTVETHRRHLISKFNVRNSVGLIKVALQKGMLSL